MFSQPVQMSDKRKKQYEVFAVKSFSMDVFYQITESLKPYQQRLAAYVAPQLPVRDRAPTVELYNFITGMIYSLKKFETPIYNKIVMLNRLTAEFKKFGDSVQANDTLIAIENDFNTTTDATIAEQLLRLANKANEVEAERVRSQVVAQYQFKIPAKSTGTFASFQRAVRAGEAQVEERMQKTYLQQAQANIAQRDNPIPHFQTKPLYNNALTPEQLLQCQKLVKSAAAAISEGNVDKLKQQLGFSTIPKRIRYIQSTHARHWEWMDAHRELLFYQRAEFLFKWYQRKLFYDAVLENAREFAKRANDAYTFHFVWKAAKRFNKMVEAARDKNGVLLVDAFAAAIQGDGQNKLRTYFATLDAKGYFAPALAKPHRQLSLAACHELKAIMQDQLAPSPGVALPHSAAAMHAVRQYLLNDKLLNDPLVTSPALINEPEQGEVETEDDEMADDDRIMLRSVETNVATPRDMYPTAITSQFRKALEDTAQLHKSFIMALNKLLYTKIDSFTVFQMLDAKVAAAQHRCEVLKLAQDAENRFFAQEVNRPLRNAEDAAIQASGIGDVNLERSEFLVKDDNDQMHNPLLHLAMKACVAAKTAIDKQKALKCVEELMARGCSPYTQNKMSANTLKDQQTAYEFCQIEPPQWLFLIATLRACIARSPFAEKLRVGLLKYCETTIEQLQNYSWKFFNGTETKISRLAHVAELVQALVAACKDFKDSHLIETVESVKNRNTTFRHSKLNELLESVLKAQQAGIVYIPDKEALEMLTTAGVPEQHLDNRNLSIKDKHSVFFASQSYGTPMITSSPLEVQTSTLLTRRNSNAS